MLRRIFEKRHADVLRSLDLLDCSTGFNQRNFASVEYLDAKGSVVNPGAETSSIAQAFLLHLERWPQTQR